MAGCEPSCAASLPGLGGRTAEVIPGKRLVSHVGVLNGPLKHSVPAEILALVQ